MYDSDEKQEEKVDMVLQIQQMLAQKGGQPLASQQTLTDTRKARRLYLGNLPQGMGLTEPQVIEFFNMATTEAGVAIMPGLPVIDAWIAPDQKYGFIEFRSIDECTASIALNGISLQGRPLTVKRPNDYEPPPDHVPTNVALAGGSHTGGMGMAAAAAGGMMPQAAAALGNLLAAAPEAPPTTVLVLTNMVTVDELKNDQEFEDIMLDAKEEAEKFGTVMSVKIPRPSTDGSAVPGVGQVFIMFDSSASASLAKDALHGRMFDGRTVIGTFIDEQKFIQGELA